MINRIVLSVAALALGITAAAAQDVIAQRKDLMKAIGAQAGQGGKFMKGEEPFDLAKAKNIFAVFATNGEKAAGLFPDSSKSGDTRALPAVWEKMDDFKAKMAKWAADSKAAQASVKDEASFKATFAEVVKDCGGCHQTYRKPQ